MRRIYFPWLISLLLVLAQHGAVLHELSHLGQGSAPHGVSVQSERALDRGPCLTCEAFAQVANPATGATATPAVAPASIIPTPARDWAIVGTDAPNPRSRGPPQA